MRSRVLCLILVLACSSPAAVHGQTTPEQREGGLQLPRELMRQPESPRVHLDLQRRLFEVERLLAVGSLARAEELIDDLLQHRQLRQRLVGLRLRLARLKNDHAGAAAIAEEELVKRPAAAHLWRELAQARLALGETGPARTALDSFLVHSPQRVSAGRVATDILRQSGRPAMAVAWIDSLRTVLAMPRFMSAQRAYGLLALGEQRGAADELADELRVNPLNLAMVRTGLLDGPFRPADHGPFVDRLALHAAAAEAASAEAVLVLDLHLARMDAPAAATATAGLRTHRDGRRLLLQHAVTLERELELLEDPGQRQAVVDHLLPVLADLAGPGEPDASRRRQAATTLASACGRALSLGALGQDPHRAADRFNDYLDVVREAHPGNAELHAARIRLATFTRDELGEPALAARRLESMLLDLDLSTEGVALVRLTLGECYLAAGDTARGRTVLTSLGRDVEFRNASGHAHFHLARLDLAGGHYATARDRFAAVALDNPAASYANDALALGLAVAEEMDNPSGGPAVLGLYAPSVYWDLLSRPDEHRAALRRFVDGAGAMVDPEAPQLLLERGLWELARLEIEAGDEPAALDLLAVITGRHADGRYPAAALAETSRLLRGQGRHAEARAALERLLTQYPEYLFADDVRDELRSLP
ncbi:MAG: tetratricopeptide repeat protein [bacterium]|nr:tetratricopeptide repeat protein [bacterium]